MESGNPVYPEKIIQCIRARYCTVPQIMKNGAFTNVGEVMNVLEQMIVAGDIERLDGGEIYGFFESGKVPKRFWLDGTGKTAYENVFKNMEVRIMSDTNGKDMTVNRKGREKKEISINQVRKLASEGKSQEKIASELSISFSKLCLDFRSNPELKKAYFDGRKIFEENQQKVWAVKSDVQASSKPVQASSAVHVTPAIPEPPKTEEKPDKPTEISCDGNVIAEPIEPQKPVQAVLVSDKRLGHTLEFIKKEEKQINNFNQVREIIVNELIPDNFVIPEKSEKIKTVALGNAGEMHINLDINLFDADKRTRDYLNKIIDLIQEFERV